MKIGKNVGPNIDPWGTSNRMLANSVKPVSLSMAWWRPSRYGSNNLRAEGLKWYNESFIHKYFVIYSIKCFAEVVEKCPNYISLSMHSIHLSILVLTRLCGNYVYHENQIDFW